MCHVIENLALVILSSVSSTDNAGVKKIFFIHFMCIILVSPYKWEVRTKIVINLSKNMIIHMTVHVYVIVPDNEFYLN